MKVTCSNAFAYEAIERLVYKVFNSKGHSSQCNAAYEALVGFFWLTAWRHLTMGSYKDSHI